MKQTIPVALLVAAAIVTIAAMKLRHEPGAELAQYRPPVPPPRTSSAPPVIPEPPALPDGADSLSPVRFTVTTTWTDARGQRRTVQHVTRSVDRVHLLMEGTRKEWLFERNPVDRRRVSGYLVDHDARQILAYQESDLRNEQQLRGWRDALLMRFDPGSLSGLQPSNENTSVFGWTFSRHLAPAGAQDGVVEVWWSDQLLLPLRLTVRERGVMTTSTIDRLAVPASLVVLDDPRVRFRGYASLDVTDSRERRH
jgi:hypothetical protein